MVHAHLRDRATTVLGERFDIRQFHDVVLGTGTVSLPVWDARMQRWIDAQQASP